MSPRPIHTVLMLSVESAARGSFESNVVPDGFIWVVRDIVLFHNGSVTQSALDGRVTSNHGVRIFEVDSNTIKGSNSMHWSGRQVVEAGDHITFFAGEDGWTCTITGYQLTVT